MDRDLESRILKLKLTKYSLLISSNIPLIVFLLMLALSSFGGYTVLSDEAISIIKLGVFILVLLIPLEIYILNKVVKNSIIVSIGTSADSRIGNALYSTYFSARKIDIDDSFIFYNSVNRLNMSRRVTLRLGKSTAIVRAEFTSSSSNTYSKIEKFKGIIIAFSDVDFNFGGKAIFWGNNIYERNRILSYHGTNNSQINFNTNSTINGFYTYFSDAETEKRLCNDNILNAIWQIKNAFNKEISVSFNDDIVYIVVENEEFYVNTDSSSVMREKNIMQSVVKLYDSLK